MTSATEKAHLRDRVGELLLEGSYTENSRVYEIAFRGLGKLSGAELDALWACMITAIGKARLEGEEASDSP